MTDRTDARKAFIDAKGWTDAAQLTIAGDASNRSYLRLTRPDGATSVLMDAPPDKGEDTAPFVRIAQYLNDQGLSAPRILAQDTQQGFLLIEDLGDALFARLMHDDPALQSPLYSAAIDALLALHRAPPLDLPVCDADWLTSMVAPVFEWYAPDLDPTAATAFDAFFHPLAATLDPLTNVVILRDFHAENLLWLPDRKGVAKVGLLDFQDALIGHRAYDLVSILQDARRDVDPKTEEAMIARYLKSSAEAEESFRRAYALIGLQRNLRILGIFARLCLRDGKASYVDLIPRVWGYVTRNLDHPDLTALRSLLIETLPEPTPEFLAQLRAKCAKTPSPR